MQSQVVINQNNSDAVRKEIRLDRLLKELKKNSFKAKQSHKQGTRIN